MTSKISYVKFIQEDFKHRSWLIGILTIVTFIFQPLTLVLGLSEKKYWMSLDGMENYSAHDLSKWLFEFMGFRNIALTTCVILFAIICGISGFYYLHSSEKLDLIHSLPVRREKLFFIHYISGLLIFFFPFTLNLLISLLSIAFQGLITPDLLQVSFSAFGIHVFFFLSLYTVVCFSMMVTGTLLSGIIGSLSLLIYGSFVLGLFRSLASRFFPTYFNEPVGHTIFSFHFDSNGLDSYSSPFLSYISAQQQLDDGILPWKLLCFVFLMTLFLLYGSIFLYRRRPTEASGRALIFPKTEPLIKVMLSVPLGIGGTLYLNKFADNYSNGIGFLILCALCTLIFALFIAFAYTLDTRKLITKKISLGISVLLSVGIVSIFQFDLLHYNTYLPDKASIKSMSAYLDSSYFSQLFTTDEYTIHQFLDESEISDFEMLYELAKIGASTYDPTDKTAQIVNMKYRLRSGRSVYRTYMINEDAVQQYAKELLEQKKYKERLFQIAEYNSYPIRSIEITDIYQNIIQIELPLSARKELLSHYHKDLLQTTGDILLSESPVCFISFFSDDNDYTFSRPMYKEFTDTFQFLADYGYSIATELDPCKISSIQLSNLETTKTVQITDEKTIAELIPYLSSFNHYFHLHPFEFSLQYKNDVSGSRSLYHLNTKEIPECIKSYIE